MAWKIVCAIVAVALLLAYLGPPIVRLKDLALIAVVLIGVGMMAVDLWQSFQEKD